MARTPTAISSAQVTALCKYIRLGLSDTQACQLAGVHREVFRWWCRKGGHSRYSKSKVWVAPEDARPEFRRFVQRIERAQAHAEQQAVKSLFVAMEHDWRAAAWYLARRYPERWGSAREKPGKVLERRPDGIVVLIPANAREHEPQQEEAS